ncbi:MAG: hypothetical protein ACLP7P_07190 [Rhodomicrobium sp.]
MIERNAPHPLLLRKLALASLQLNAIAFASIRDKFEMRGRLGELAGGLAAFPPIYGRR